MDKLKICNKCEIEKLNGNFYLWKDGQRYTNKCKQYLNDKQREWRVDNYDRYKSYE